MPLGRKNNQDNIKRASYYVCFIGAKESPVVRDHDYGREFVYPAMEYLLRSVVEAGPISNAPKITLQVSGKGLKIMQNVSRSGLVQSRISAGKTDTLRHFIPHHCITCAYQGPPPYDDLVATILLIYNPTTRCPVHIHVYRCDSSNTAAFLTQQLVIMSQRQENQMKFAEIEAKLSGRGLLHPLARQPQPHDNSPQNQNRGKIALSDDQASSRAGSSDSGVGGAPTSTTRAPQVHYPRTTAKADTTQRAISVMTSSSTGHPSNGHTPQPTSPIANVTKLTAEFQQRLKTRDSAPILLPPKDYDTVSRNRGNTEISLIKSSQAADASVQTSGRGSTGVPEDMFNSSNRSPRDLKNRRPHHKSSDDILKMEKKKGFLKKKKKKAESEDDDDWHIDEDEDEEDTIFTNSNREQPIITKLADFDTDLFQERLKRYSSLSDVFGDANDQIVKIVSSKPVLPQPPPAAPTSSSSDASAAYRPRPYYFTPEEEAEVEVEKETQKKSDLRRRDVEDVKRMMAREERRLEEAEGVKEEQIAIIPSWNVRPNLPVKRNQRPVVNERVRPASFYERIRFDDRDFQEGKFVRPEMVYYQYRS